MAYHDQVALYAFSQGSSESPTSTGTRYVSAFIRPKVIEKLRTIPGLNASELRAES
jgi:hypothetical protein